MEEFDRLFEIIKTLRGENGCPWDKEQTIGTMAPNVIEESYELVEAIDNNKNEDLEEEIGDLFFLTLFIAYVGEQENRFTVSNVINGIAEKLIRRHPHVFKDTIVNDVDQVLENWETIKLSETKNQSRKTPFDGIPKGLPEIQRFYKILSKIKRTGKEIKQPDKVDLKASFNQLLENDNEANLKEFTRLFLSYTYQKNKDLSKVIRDLSKETIEGFLKDF